MVFCSPTGGKTDLGRDVNLSPPRFGRRQTGTSQSLSVLSRLDEDVLCDGDLVLHRIRHLIFSLRLALLNFFWVVFQ